MKLRDLIRELIKLREYKLAFMFALNQYRVIRLLRWKERYYGKQAALALARERHNRRCHEVARSIKRARDEAAVMGFKAELSMLDQQQER